jgi:hypothetical protein
LRTNVLSLRGKSLMSSHADIPKAHPECGCCRRLREYAEASTAENERLREEIYQYRGALMATAALIHRLEERQSVTDEVPLN